MLDIYYLIIVLPVVLIAMGIQASLQSTYKKYAEVYAACGRTGAQMAQKVLQDNGIHNVTVERIQGKLTDHYHPKDRVIRLSEGVYDSTSVAALGIACHEAGHAVQHHINYSPIRVRNAILPAANIGSTLSWPLIFAGLIFGFTPLVQIGFVLFAFVALFQLVTLPVEFDASRRAIRALDDGLLDSEEISGAKKVLRSAAMTYVAALAVSVANLLRLFLLTRRRD